MKHLVRPTLPGLGWSAIAHGFCADINARPLLAPAAVTTAVTYRPAFSR